MIFISIVRINDVTTMTNKMRKAIYLLALLLLI